MWTVLFDSIQEAVQGAALTTVGNRCQLISQSPWTVVVRVGENDESSVIVKVFRKYKSYEVEREVYSIIESADSALAPRALATGVLEGANLPFIALEFGGNATLYSSLHDGTNTGFGHIAEQLGRLTKQFHACGRGQLARSVQHLTLANLYEQARLALWEVTNQCAEWAPHEGPWLTLRRLSQVIRSSVLPKAENQKWRLSSADACPGLVHGDLWSRNILLTSASQQAAPKLIDFEYAHIGDVAFDFYRAYLRAFRINPYVALDETRAPPALWQSFLDGYGEPVPPVELGSHPGRCIVITIHMRTLATYFSDQWIHLLSEREADSHVQRATRQLHALSSLI